jgi:hypothetical protein
MMNFISAKIMAARAATAKSEERRGMKVPLAILVNRISESFFGEYVNKVWLTICASAC